MFLYRLDSDPYIRISQESYYQWTKDDRGYLRLDAPMRGGKKLNCKPGVSIPCGNACVPVMRGGKKTKCAKKQASETPVEERKSFADETRKAQGKETIAQAKDRKAFIEEQRQQLAETDKRSKALSEAKKKKQAEATAKRSSTPKPSIEEMGRELLGLTPVTPKKPNPTERPKQSPQAQNRQAKTEASAKARETDFHSKTWGKSFGNAPADVASVIAKYDQPDKLEVADPNATSHFKAGSKAIHMAAKYKPGEAYANGVYRHEYGHFLDYEIARKQSKIDPMDAIARSVGLDGFESVFKIQPPEKRNRAYQKMIKLSLDKEDELGSSYASTSKKGRSAFDEDEKTINTRQANADKKFNELIDRYPKNVQKKLADSLGIQDLRDLKAKRKMGRVLAEKEAVKAISQQAIDRIPVLKERNIKSLNDLDLANRNKIYEKFGDKYFGDQNQIIGLTYQKLKTQYPDKIHEIVPKLMAIKNTGDIEGLTSHVNTALRTNNVNDLVGSITQNKVAYGHDSKYYKNKPLAKYTESFANIFDLYSRNDPLASKFLDVISPKSKKFLQETLANA